MAEYLKPVYSRLQDEFSKNLFSNRLLYNLTDDYRYIKNIIDVLPEASIIRKLLNKHDNQPKVLFGAGTWGRRFHYAFSDISWKCFVDNKLAGTVICGIPVLSLEEMVSLYPDAFIVVSTRFFHEEIENQLLSFGITPERIIFFDSLMEGLFGIQYFDLPKLEHNKDEVFVDVGGFDGKTSLDFVKWSGNCYKKIYTFEPNPAMINQCKSALKEIHDCNIINKGCWDHSGYVEFVEDEEKQMGSHFNENADLCSNGIEVVRIDEALANDKATFIKMDVEGAELKAIIGAETQIKKNKPKCAISIYHKPEDIWEIPLKLLEYREDYKFFLRQYSLTIAELILYAI